MSRRRSSLAALAAALGTLAVPEAASAHGLGGRADVPIPTWLLAWAAAVVLIVSFIALATLWRTPKLEGDASFRPLPWWLGMAIVNPVIEIAAGAIGVGLLFLTIWAGLAGTESPQANFTPTFVFVIFWVGLVPASLLFGDLYRAFNPWRAIGRAAGFTTARILGELPRPFRYPEWLGRWPAILPILCFTWMELIYLDGQLPSRIAVAAMVYSAYTLVAMAAFGTDTWLRVGEGFSVYFNFFSRISPLCVRDGRLGLRPPLAGLTTLDVIPGTVGFIVVAIGTVTFDGASEGSRWAAAAASVQDFFHSIGFGLVASIELAGTVGMAVAIGLIAAIYSTGIAGVRSVDHRPFVQSARSFAHTLVPIAAAYVLAHYVSFLVFNGQAMAYLASDPLGRGSDLFGTAGSSIDYSILSATAIWYVQVAVLVIGHVFGLVLAHDRALAMYDDVRVATRSQYWMLAVMVGFTTFGLWLLSQANS
ncbi:MAG: fenitrothion hydrolase [Solirubrobacterales bacterium]